MRNVKNVLITGASSGLGAALASAYAEPGAHLFLAGRDENRLRRVAQDVLAKGATVVTKGIDVTDELAMASWICACDSIHPIDLVIANAGISGGVHKREAGQNDDKAVLRTNIDGVLNTILPIIPLMKKRGRGQIAVMASLAAFRGMPGAPAYGASKAAARVYGEALRGELSSVGVEVNVVCPGFVDTPMTEVNTCPMPFLMPPDKAAKIIRAGLAANKARIAFPWPMAALVWLFAAAPSALIDLLSIGYTKD